MKEFLKKMKDPKYKFLGYMLGLFIMFIIALCLPKNNSNTVNTINNDKDTPNTTDNQVLEFLNNQEDYTYNFKYVLKVNDQTITYQGQKTNNEEYITIEGNSYLIKDSLIYIKSGDIYQIYNDNIYTNKMELFTNGKILTNYINKGYLKDNTYLINLKDIIYNYEDNDYIKVSSNISNNEYIINIECKDYLNYIYKDIENADIELIYSNIVKKS